jgi:peptidoglycan/xylan/chitin deacetylase (PgdA/CDA1 family)
MTWHAEPRAGQNRIFLTFDDGPHPQFTPAILDTLNEHNAKDSDIVLLHDKHLATVEAVRRIDPELLHRGFSLHGLSDT